jgi:hypothetical protein
MSDDNVIEFPGPAHRLGEEILEAAIKEAAEMVETRVFDVAEAAIEQADGDYAAAMVLLNDAFELIEERYVGIELRAKAERILGPSRRPGPEAA